MTSMSTDALWGEISRQEMVQGLAEWSRRAAITAFIASRPETEISIARVAEMLTEDPRFLPVHEGVA